MANIIRYRLRTDTAANWNAGNPVLLSGEPGFDSTAKRLKWGDGATEWNDLPYIGPQVVNDLTTGGADKVLSAEQGKQLKAAIDGKTYNEATTSAAGLMSAADKTKLNGIAANANNYTHPTGNGNNHLPSGGSSGQVLLASGSGAGTWGSVPSDSTKLNANALNNETWTFTLEDGTTVTKAVALWNSQT